MCSPCMARTDKDRCAPQLVAIERMHRLRQFRHDEVRQVDDVVDRVQADRVSRYCSHSGEGCTVTFSKTSAL